MSVVNELFGQLLTQEMDKQSLRHARCPHMGGNVCDGGGNRDMMRWRADAQPLAPFFDPAVGRDADGFIPCGVCSVEISNRHWAVCPRRLFTLGAMTPSDQQRPLRDVVLRLAGFGDGDVVRVWSEVSLRDTTGLNYRLDYVLRTRDRPPIILEVMTASTSGGNKSKRTDMQSAFCDSVLYAHGVLPELRPCPGVNVRQVWARMASQIIVKSEIANQWGGRTIWIVQDTLMAYIGSQTGLKLDQLLSADWKTGEVNVVSASIDDPEDIKLYAGPVHSIHGEACWTELLSAPAIPKITSLTDRLSDDRVVTTFTVSNGSSS